jgi:crotonobetainyl-CoA:carnitine CoA-transferase CaiB-like acyl-CoA transferase
LLDAIRENEVMNGPLTGLKVVEIGVAMAGPYAAMTLADYGADVIKVERVDKGDDSRAWTPFFGEMSHYFASANRNKKSLAIDLKDPEGAAVLRRLISQADILIDNFRFGALERSGLGYESLRAENPKLIYCCISGFGASGPKAGEAANDLFMQAFSGGMSITGTPDSGPMRMGLSVCDIGAGMLGTIGILMALEHRHRTGLGQRVDTSLLEGQISMMSYHLTRYFASGEVPQPVGSGSLISVPYQAYRAADDWIVIAAFNHRMWVSFCDEVGRSEWVTDPRFDTPKARARNRDELVGLIGDVIARDNADVWERRLNARGVPATLVNSLDAVVEHEQVAAREMIVGFDTPQTGPMRMAGLPIKFSDTPGTLRSAPPQLGADTMSVLLEAGYEAEEIARLTKAGVLGCKNQGKEPA